VSAPVAGRRLRGDGDRAGQLVGQDRVDLVLDLVEPQERFFAGYEALGAQVDLDSKSIQDLSLVYHAPRLGLRILF
jgi:hypothetical protein